MAAISDPAPIFHNIRVKLYPNYLPAAKGKYPARTDSGRTVNVRGICTIMVTLTGFDGSFDTLHDYVNQFLDEMAYQLCDGFTVNNGYFTIRPNIGGTFETAAEVYDHQKHPINFSFSQSAELKKLVKNINVVVEGIAANPAFIDMIEDVEEHTVNTGIMAGSAVAVHGNRIKVEGTDPSCGVYFVPPSDPAQAVKAIRILENNPSRVMVIVPPLNGAVNRIEIITQFSGGSALSAARTISAPFTVEQI
jgi:hypothetical protein